MVASRHIEGHVDGEWTIENVEMHEILGERNDVEEKVIPHEKMFSADRIDVNNVEFEVDLPPTTIKKKYDLYVTIVRKHRRHNEEPIVYKD